MIEILYEDEGLIVANKPAGLAIHRSKMVRNTTEFLVDELKNQLGYPIFPVHRLDRKTSGAIIVAKNKESLAEYMGIFRDKKVYKTYIAITRGYISPKGSIDYAITNDAGKLQEAVTHYSRISTSEVPLATEKYPSSRYSYITVTPQHGRYHQIRKHLAHIHHPIIGDRPHGCNKQNRMLKKTYGWTKMFLHAHKLEIPQIELVVEAPLPNHFRDALVKLELEY